MPRSDPPRNDWLVARRECHRSRVKVLSYQDLRVWQAGMDLVIRVYRLTRRLPASERYGLAIQMQRAAISIPANIAEGHGRRHLGDKLHHFSIANGSLKELETEVLISERLGFATSTEAQGIGQQASELGRMLTCLMRTRRCHSVSTTTHNLPPAN